MGTQQTHRQNWHSTQQNNENSLRLLKTNAQDLASNHGSYSSIAPPHLRGQETTQRIHDLPNDIPLRQVTQNAPTTKRLKSRKLFYNSNNSNFDVHTAWKTYWQKHKPVGADLITDLTKALLGFSTATRKMWSTANRMRSRQARTASNLNRWGLLDSPTCNEAPQDTDHLVIKCQNTKLTGGYTIVSQCGQNFKNWIDNMMVNVWRPYDDDDRRRLNRPTTVAHQFKRGNLSERH